MNCGKTRSSKSRAFACVFNQRTCLQLPLQVHKFVVLLVRQYCNCNCIEHQIGMLCCTRPASSFDLDHLSNHTSDPIEIAFLIQQTNPNIYIYIYIYNKISSQVISVLCYVCISILHRYSKRYIYIYRIHLSPFLYIPTLSTLDCFI